MVNIANKIENIIERYQDLIYQEAQNQKRDLAILSSKELETIIEEIQKERVLKIGIVGRVKAGKSSLLNALIFDGDSILPKAATPMTAALTILKYSPTLQAQVEFFTKEDIQDIKRDSELYEDRLDKLTTKKFEEKKEQKLKRKKELTQIELDDMYQKSKKQAQRELKNMSASFEQYQKIKNTGIDINSLNQFEILKADDIYSLSSKLIEYVGANGKYMPFTKSVTIKMPNEMLKGLEIIDTPGVNDPVVSREERTRELLKYCDVIFIIASSGQFPSQEDSELLDRITAKEGIRELFIIASQIDNQLFGSEKERYGGVLRSVLEGISAKLSNQISQELLKLKKANPEIGTVFDSLIKDNNDKFLYSSGICASIKHNFDNKNKWDDGMQKVWDNLTREYPQEFNNKDIALQNLNLLSNIEAFQEKIDRVSAKKEKILDERITNFTQTKIKTLNQYRENLISYTKNQIKKLEDSDIKEIKKQKEKLVCVKNRVSRILDEEFYDLVDELDISIKKQLLKKLSSFFRVTQSDINSAQSEESSTVYKTIQKKQSGFIGGTKRFFGSIFGQDDWGMDEETIAQTEYYTTARSGAIRDTIETLIDKIEIDLEEVANKIILDWRKSVYKNILQTLRKHIDDDDLDVDIIKSTIRNVVNSVEYPEITYNTSLPVSLRKSGVLKGFEAEEFLEIARDFVYELEENVKTDIKNYQKELIKSLKNQTLAKDIFVNYEKDIEKLEEEIKSKELTIHRYSALLKELEGI